MAPLFQMSQNCHLALLLLQVSTHASLPLFPFASPLISPFYML
jgi:hypothetical protein